MHSNIDKIKKNESSPKVIKNLFNKEEISKFINLYEQLPITVHNKKQNVIKKRWLKEYGKELEELFYSKLKNEIGEFKYDNLNILSQIIVWMIICFIVPFILNTFLFLFNISPYSIIDLFQVSPSISELFFKPWSLITYGFFHADLWHLLGNMIILYFSGRVVLDLFGTEKFLGGWVPFRYRHCWKFK